MTDTKELERLLKRVLRIGKVVDINPARCRVRVEFPDSEIVSHELPIIRPHTAGDKFYSMPTIDEYVLCAFIPVGRETGFILGSYYSQATPPPVTDAAKFNVTFEDGTVLEYDKALHRLTADVKGEAEIKTEKNINVTAGENITVKADGNINVTCAEAEVKADKITVKSTDITLGDGAATGIITQECFCSLTGGPHPDKSETVKGVK